MSRNSTKRKKGRSPGRSPGRPQGRPGKVKPASASDWIEGARLRTLPLAIAPVLAGTGAAIEIGAGQTHLIRAACCLVVALLLQIGVNFANDYSDGVRGTDAYRTGPPRLTGSGKAKPRTVLVVALVFFALAALAGLVLVIDTRHWWLLVAGAAAIAAAWFYTGGKRPYGYYGLGELVVFVFFGLVATVGSTYVQVGSASQSVWLAGAAIGFIASAVLMVNNIRDIESDRAAGKRTLAVLLGNRWSRIVFCAMLFVAFAIAALLGVFYVKMLLMVFVLLLAIPAAVITLTAKTSGELVLALKLTSFTAMAYGLLIGWAFAF